ncbi:ParB N-terminal domain-containing protein [Deinococcus navajonensis]|uniref:ParB N-terminal domain-containing protein n=1 Tax=Deinococcus navajonensis TaxID=309884 RepID=A0ABV8XIY6_9DEIO
MQPRLLNETGVLTPVGGLKLHPRNPNAGNVDVIAESIRTNGFYGAEVVQKSTGHILKGNHTFQAACQVGLPQIPVFWLDVDDAAALRILLVDNRHPTERAVRPVRDQRPSLLSFLLPLKTYSF